MESCKTIIGFCTSRQLDRCRGLTPPGSGTGSLPLESNLHNHRHATGRRNKGENQEQRNLDDTGASRTSRRRKHDKSSNSPKASCFLASLVFLEKGREGWWLGRERHFEEGDCYPVPPFLYGGTSMLVARAVIPCLPSSSAPARISRIGSVADRAVLATNFKTKALSKNFQGLSDGQLCTTATIERVRTLLEKPLVDECASLQSQGRLGIAGHAHQRK